MQTSDWFDVSSNFLLDGDSMISLRFGFLSFSSEILLVDSVFSSVVSFAVGTAAAAIFGNDGGGGAGPFSFLITYSIWKWKNWTKFE